MTPSTQDARATGLVKLAERVEAATNYSRELDDAIAAAVFRYAGMSQLLGVPDDQQFRTFAYVNGSIGSSLRYTASLDAAMTLVPEGWAVSSMSAWPASPEDATNPTPPTASVELVGTSLERWGRKMVWGHKGSDGRVQSTATDLPRALTAAALRALAASTKDMNHDG